MTSSNHDAVRPIFLHSGMRTGSTYIFNKFRQAPGSMVFYEPFSEELGRQPLEFLLSHGPDTWDSHHSPSDPYYLEYVPLFDHARGLGITGFDADFTFQNYFRTTEELPRQRAYLQSLLNLANSQHQRPVLSFCKSMGRFPWMATRFPGAVHITFLRNPLQQWLSGFDFHQRTQNLYFMASPVIFLSNPGDSPYIHAISQSLQPLLTTGTYTMEQLYEVFLHVWAYTSLLSAPTSHLVLDMDLLSESDLYRSLAASRIRELTGIALDFSDCRIQNHTLPAEPSGFAAVNARVIQQISPWLPAQASDGSRSITAQILGKIMRSTEQSAVTPSPMSIPSI